MPPAPTITSPAPLFRTTNAWSEREGWELLYYYNVYRVCLALILVVLASPLFSEVTAEDLTIDLWGPILGIALVSLLTFINIRRRSPKVYIQAHALFLLDILFISILTFSNKLLDSSTIIFYVTTVAATAVVFRIRMALAYASLCVLIIIYRELVQFNAVDIDLGGVYFAIVFVIGLYSLVLAVGYIAQKSLKVQTMVAQQELVLADLDQINHIVIERLELGIIFLGSDLKIKLINDVARKLIGGYQSGDRIVGRLARLISQHLQMATAKQFNFNHRNKRISLRSIPLRNGLLIHLEDETLLNRKIQQTKLASVGRMASAISHEIRNPLNAINHAAQLLKPDDIENEEDAELIDIIRKHAMRIDYIIESVLQRSSPGKARQHEIHLQQWLSTFIETFRQMVESENLSIEQEGDDLSVYFDATQLEQIITNLCQNSIKYAKPDSGRVEIRLRTGVDQFGTPYLEVTDNGQGIEESRVDEMFEPFQSSDSQSTGLGLFLVREFCTLNGADIEYFIENDRHGFRISFQLQEKIVGQQ